MVYLQRAKGPTYSTNSPSKSTKSPSGSEVENASVVDVQGTEVKAEKSDNKGINIEGATEEGIKSVINFLKEKIPGLKVKVMNIDIAEEVMDDTDSVKQLMQDGDDSGSSEDSEGESDLEELQPDGVALEGGNDASEEEKDLDTKLFIGGVVHNEDSPTKDEYVRVPADVKEVERDSFVLHVPGKSLEYETGESKMPKVKVAAIAAQVFLSLCLLKLPRHSGVLIEPLQR